jgi:DNA-binding CsgD family transcriptional regulator
MQKLGQVMNPRDVRGWMIPRPNTKRRQVYDRLVAGKKAGEIMQELGLSRPAFNSHRYFITSSAKANRSSYVVKNQIVRTLRRVGDEFVEVHG